MDWVKDNRVLTIYTIINNFIISIKIYSQFLLKKSFILNLTFLGL